MSVISGCQEGKATPELVEVKCPNCGSLLEVFVCMGGDLHRTGRLAVPSECENCGYVADQEMSATDFEKY